MAQVNITNFKALKAYKRFSEFCKLMMAGFSAIMFFSYDKIECDTLKIKEGVLTGAGIFIAGVTFMAYTKAADHIETEIDEKSDDLVNLAAYKSMAATIDKNDRRLYTATMITLGVSALLFIISPLLCEKEGKTEKVKNVINHYQTTIRPNSGRVYQKQPAVTTCTPRCKQAILQGRCGCRR